MPTTVPAKTYGLTHIALRVRDPDASARFYCTLLGAKVTYRDRDHVEVQTPGRRDVIAFVRDPSRAGRRGGVEHFGFRLVRAGGIAGALRAIAAAGGKVKEAGEFSPGHPYVFFEDADGYEVEIWYE